MTDKPMDEFEVWFNSKEEDEKTPYEWVRAAWQASERATMERIIAMIEEIDEKACLDCLCYSNVLEKLL